MSTDGLPRRMPTSASNQRGQSLTETAIFITMLMLLLAGVIDLGRAYYTYLSLKDAAAEGAAYGSIEPGDLTGIDARVRGESPAGLIDWTGATVTTTFPGGAACRGYGVRVEVMITYNFLTPFIGAIAGSQSIPLRANVVNTILSPPC
ncbi:MAG TPA: TadE/TadG family type IV pilus assembly protein [Anaerolineales bacterium]|nr:TadE/TadG family type IV pilus assembly protein [Anaerolineales bacterium]